MASRSSFAIDVVETAYRLEGSETEWFQRVLGALSPEFTRGLGELGVAYHIKDDRLVVDHLIGHQCSDAFMEMVRTMYASLQRGAVRAIGSYRGGIYAFSEFLRGLPANEQAIYRDAIMRSGLRDGLIASHPDGDGGWVTFAAMSDAPVRTFPRQRQIWHCLCAHLATAWRLRTRLGTTRSAIDAVIHSDGRIVSAHAEAATSTERERLSHAAQAIDRARGRLRHRDPAAAIELWKGLVSGRWSLVERSGASGARILVAHQNDPRAPDPRGLSPRERAIVELVLTGASNKQVAYTLGLAPTTIASHLQRALKKLNLTSRIELVRVGALARKTAPRVTVGDDELGMLALDAQPRACSLPLTAAERDVALLVCEGLTNAQIADRRGSAERTVANQLARIFAKLSIGSRAELVLRIDSTQ
jgi:DNA-binding NarL/FixJ family response regulator